MKSINDNLNVHGQISAYSIKLLSLHLGKKVVILQVAILISSFLYCVLLTKTFGLEI